MVWDICLPAADSNRVLDFMLVFRFIHSIHVTDHVSGRPIGPLLLVFNRSGDTPAAPSLLCYTTSLRFIRFIETRKRADVTIAIHARLTSMKGENWVSVIPRQIVTTLVSGSTA